MPGIVSPLNSALHVAFQGATVAIMAGTAGAASLGESTEEDPVKPKSSRTSSRTKSEMQ